LLSLKDRIKRDIDYFVPIAGCMNMFVAGATGMTCVPACIIPKSYRLFMDLYEAREFDKLRPVHAGITRFNELCDRYRSTEARYIKICWRLFKQPGAVLHPPFVMPPDAELEAFGKELTKCGLTEVDEMARAAGLA
jgi:dihydrodipicolinate synthase/N-acetylneuraminate lyase